MRLLKCYQVCEAMRLVRNCPVCHATNSFQWDSKPKHWVCKICGYTSDKNVPTRQTELS